MNYRLNGQLIKFYSLDANARLLICTWLYWQQLKVKAAKQEWSELVGYTEGIITRQPKECSGVWGYEGDSIAIYIDEQPYPSRVIANLNKEMLPTELQALFNEL